MQRVSIRTISRLILSDKTKILFLVGGFSIGGTERHLSQILPRLTRGDRLLRVCALGTDGPFSAPIRAAGIPIKFIKSRNILRIPRLRGIMNLLSQTLQVAEELRRTRPEIVHCFLSEPCSIGWAASTLVGRRHHLVMSKRSQMARPGAFPGDKALEVLALRSADAVIGHSRVVVEELASHGVNPKRLSIIHNGIEIVCASTQREEVRGIHGWGDDTVVFVVLANLIPYKGHAELMQALAIYDLEVSTNWALVLVGGGADSTYGHSLRRQAVERGIISKVYFVGQVNDPRPWLAAADVGVLLSHHEGFSNAIIEYMAAGLPVIATAVGGNLDAVVDGVSGWLVPSGDKSTLLRALIESRDPVGRCVRGQSGLRRYEAEFTINQCVNKYESFYASLAAEARQ